MSYRLLRAQKNRHGRDVDMGVFTMEATGLEAVADPSHLFLSPDDERGVSSAVTGVAHGDGRKAVAGSGPVVATGQ